MKLDLPSKVLITGIDGFTGPYLSKSLNKKGIASFGLSSDLRDIDSLTNEIKKIEPDAVIHLAGISTPNPKDYKLQPLYEVNVLGTINLLQSLTSLRSIPNKIILASSAYVYGNQSNSPLKEDFDPNPNNHYGCSKLSMEFLAKNYFNKLPIIITRPFNYIGLGQDGNFLIPKIISAFKSERQIIELGNLSVQREFNDVRDISEIYIKLLSSSAESETVNLCSQRAITPENIIESMNKISNFVNTLPESLKTAFTLRESDQIILKLRFTSKNNCFFKAVIIMVLLTFRESSLH